MREENKHEELSVCACVNNNNNNNNNNENHNNNDSYFTTAALLNTTIYSYSETFHGWTRFGSYEMYGITSNPNVPGLYIKYVGDNHFQVVKSTA